MSVSKFGMTIKSQSSSKVTEIENKVSKSGDILYGDLNFNGYSIKNLANPEDNTNRVNERYLNSFVRFKERISVGSKLAIMRVNNNSNPITSQNPIQIRGNDIIGVRSISSLPDAKFIIQSIPKSRTSLELRSTLVLKGVAYPTDPSDAANKQFVLEKLAEFCTRNVSLNNNWIMGVANPIDSQDAATMLTPSNQHMMYID